jgi:hypothetical protein
MEPLSEFHFFPCRENSVLRDGNMKFKKKWKKTQNKTKQN